MLKWLENNRIVSANIAVILAIIIFYFSSIPGSQINLPGMNFSIIYHFGIFFLFAFFLFISMKGNRKINQKFVIITLLLVLIYAILDEIHQIFVPLRTPSVNDLLVDALGGITSIILYSYFRKD